MKPLKSSFQRLFPDTKIAAYYNSFSQIITLAKYNKSEYENINLDNLIVNDIDKISLFEHEFTHWLDHISTLWGQRNLVLIYNALNARVNENIDEFWRIKYLSTSFSSDDFFHYFTEDFNLHNGKNKNPWRYQISSGIRFSETGKPEYNKPILFVRFSCYDSIPLIRVPISVASILETNAINAEFISKVSLAHNIDNIIEKNLKLTEIRNEWSSMLYNKDFALYTVVAHLTANLYHETDIATAYKVSSSIGTTVLNLPEDIYNDMKLTKVGQKEWDKKIIEFQRIKDKGFGFYNLLKNLIDEKGRSQYSIENLLKCSNLPTKEQLEDLIINEMKKNKELLIEGPFKRMAEEIIDKGIEIFKIRGIDGNNINLKDKLHAIKVSPKLMFGDTLIDDTNFDVLKVLEKLNQNVDLSLDEVYLTYEFYDKKFNEFVKACGI